MVFPLTFVPQESWKVDPRRFGAPRSNGKRKHAGCDLYAPVGTPVHAVADGKILSFRSFYLGTYSIVVQHENFVVRYGEVKTKMADGVAVGSTVKEGQVIGYVGKLAGLNVSMIHFEMYDGSATGELTQPKAPYYRRSDLMDPTLRLDEWKNDLPKP